MAEGLFRGTAVSAVGLEARRAGARCSLGRCSRWCTPPLCLYRTKVGTLQAREPVQLGAHVWRDHGRLGGERVLVNREVVELRGGLVQVPYEGEVLASSRLERGREGASETLIAPPR